MNTFCKLFIILAVLITASAVCAQGAASKPPEIGPARVAKVTSEPAAPRTGDKLKVQVEFGADTVRAEVVWTIHGEEVERQDVLQSTSYVDLDRPIKGGDNIEVAVTPFDSQQVPGKAVVTRIFVNNAPPSIKMGEQKIRGNTYQAQVFASDPEDELASLTLEQAPPGMTIDNNGLITWKFSDSTAGKFDIKVSAKDKHGAEAILTYSFTIKRSGQ
jgi:hypothetical protein